MIIIDNFVFDTLKRLDSLKENNCLDIRSYKKNRKIVIEKLKDNYNLYEDGFYKETYLNLSKNDLKKLLKTIEKREFPRSNKLRFYILETKEESICRANYREEIEIEDTEENLKLHLELPYSLLSPAKALIDKINGEILTISYSENISVTISLSQEEYSTVKSFFKDKADVKIFSI